MKTRKFNYAFDISNGAERAQWEELKAKLTAREKAGEAGHQMHSHGGTVPPLENSSEEIEIEPKCLFDNQWNTTTERVFDWYLNYELNCKTFRRGHWVEITPEMLAARRETLKCGYCGQHYGTHDPSHLEIPPSHFCQVCLDSPYLKQAELHLLRLLPLSPEGLDREPLNPDETAIIGAAYVRRQTTGANSRAVANREKQKADVIAKHQKALTAANNEFAGMIWIWEKGLSLENVIYYSYTDKFSFGWRQPVSADVKDKLLNVMSEFPFNYEIKSEDGNFERLND